LPAKHAVRTFGTARAVLSFAVAVLVFLVVWTAMRAVGPAQASRQPSVVLPSTPQLLVQPPVSPSATPSRTVRPSRTLSSPAPAKTRKATVKPAATRTRPNAAATVTVGWSRGRGYFANVEVVNKGTKPLQWRVTVSHGERGVRLGGVWGASGSQQDQSMVFRGGALAPGASVSFGYQAMGYGRGEVRPTGCSVLGGTCGMR